MMYSVGLPMIEDGLSWEDHHTLLKEMGFKHFRNLSPKEYDAKTRQLVIQAHLGEVGFFYDHYEKNVLKGAVVIDFKLGDSLFTYPAYLFEESKRFRWNQYIYIGDKSWQKNP